MDESNSSTHPGRAAALTGPVARRMPGRPAARPLGAVLAAGLVALGCQSLSYDEPDAPPPPAPHDTTASSAGDAEGWSTHANAAREALRVGDLEEAETHFMACLTATEAFGDRDVRRLAALAIPAGLAERQQREERWDDAARVMDAVLAEGQGGVAFPLDAWALALQTRLDVDRIQQGPEAEIELARRIAEIHLGPTAGATPAEVAVRQRVGRLLATHGETQVAAGQLGWAARAASSMLKLSLNARLELLYEAAALSSTAGDPTTSDFLLRDAVDLARASRPGSLEEISALNQRGWFLIEQDRAEQALPLLEAARDVVAEIATPPAVAAATLDSLAVALHRLGRLEEASAVLDQALASRAAASDSDRAQLSVLDEHRAALDADLAAGSSPPPAASEAESGL